MKISQGFGFIKSHSSYMAISNNWFTNSSNTAGYIYIVRDPRDVAISWAKHANLTYDKSIDFMLDFNSCIEWARANSELPDHINRDLFYLLGMSMFRLGQIMIYQYLNLF